MAVREWYALRVASATDEREAYALMNEMLGELKQSHLSVKPPSPVASHDSASARAAGPALIPVRVRWIDGHPIVVQSDVYGLDSSLPAGARVIAIDDLDLASLGNSALPSSLQALERRIVVDSALSCPLGGQKSIRFIPPGQIGEETRSVPCQDPGLARTSFGQITQATSVRSLMVEGTKVGYLAFNIWLVPMMREIETRLQDLRRRGMQSLVIDLRGNPGGVGMMVVPFARQFFTQDVNLGTMRMRSGKQEFNVSGNANAFTGTIVVLVDEGSASTSEIFAQAMQDLGRATVFGASNTPGAALPSLIEELPGGAMLQYVVADYRSPSGAGVEGRGVHPDTVVPERAVDFAMGKDPVLDAAVTSLAQAPAPAPR